MSGVAGSHSSGWTTGEAAASTGSSAGSAVSSSASSAVLKGAALKGDADMEKTTWAAGRKFHQMEYFELEII